MWPWGSNFQDSSGVKGGQKWHGMCHKPPRPFAQVPPTSQCIPYLLSEASFSFLLQPCHLIFPDGFFSSPGCQWDRTQVPGFFYSLSGSPQPLALMFWFLRGICLPEIWLPGPIVETESKQLLASEKCPVQLASCGWTGGWIDDDTPDCRDHEGWDWSVSTHRCIPSTLPGV